MLAEGEQNFSSYTPSVNMHQEAISITHAQMCLYVNHTGIMLDYNLFF